MDLNETLSAAMRDFMADHRISRRDVAARLDRSIDYVQGRVSGKRALSVDIISAVAQLAGISDRALMTEIMSKATGTGQGSSER